MTTPTPPGWFASILTDKFSSTPHPLPVFATHCLTILWLLHSPIDSRPRHPLASLSLSLVAIVSGGTVTSVCLGGRPGWLASDMVVLGYSLAWLVFRSDAVFKFFRALILPGLAVQQVFRASIIAIVVSSAGAVLRGSIFGPVFLSVMTAHGCTWIAQLIARVSDGSLLPGLENDFVDPSPSLRVTFWASLFYLIGTDASGIFGAPLLPHGIVNITVIAACEIDFVVNTILKVPINICAPVEWPIWFLLNRVTVTANKPKEVKVL